MRTASGFTSFLLGIGVLGSAFRVLLGRLRPGHDARNLRIHTVGGRLPLRPIDAALLTLVRLLALTLLSLLLFLALVRARIGHEGPLWPTRRVTRRRNRHRRSLATA